ncbi:MAG: ribonuclease H-like domain-containing protein [Candidatus Zixiibacteriota bacterium]|nr:MAG: ribonuclease H-like domain-containing protein [candidate division Zixibacteria bacterium]
MPEKKLKNKLDRFGTLTKADSKTSQLTTPPERYTKLARAAGGKTVVRRAGTYCLVKTTYPYKYNHGNMVLDRIQRQTVPLSAFRTQDEKGALDLKNMLFVDTETTGLGGAGAVAFVVGCGSLGRGGFEIRQYLLPDYSDEAGMLEDVLTEFATRSVPVTYNGAAFDMPLLRDRMILNRVASDIDYDHHIDLLHATRRLFRRRLRDCSLISIEEQVFDFFRTDDIPGYLIPSIYFEWLSEENLDLVSGVLEHNRLDIVSLLCLVYLLAEIHETEGGVLNQVDDLHSLSRVYGRRRDGESVSRVFSRIDEIGGNSLADDIVLYHAMNFKRTGDIVRAVEMWQSLAESDSREAYWANLELAKYYEHREKDFPLALHHTRLAKSVCPYGHGHHSRLAARLSRLTAKLRS